MNKETYEALEEVITQARKYASILHSKKRKSNDDHFTLAVLYRDIVKVEKWIDETAKEYTNQ